MACKHGVRKSGGYIECSLEGPGAACVASDSDLAQKDCDCYEEEDKGRLLSEVLAEAQQAIDRGEPRAGR